MLEFQVFFLCRVLFKQSSIQLVGGFLLDFFQHMTVNVHGDLIAGMSQPLLCDLGGDAKRKHDRGIDMPKVMKPNVLQIIRFQKSPKLHGKGIAFVGRAVLLADDVIILSGVAFCFGVFQQPQQRSRNLNLPSAALCFRGFGDRLIVDSYQIFFDSETAGLKIHMMPPQCE